MAAMLMAGITSCSNDDLLEAGSSSVLDTDQSFFVNINIANTESMTRAGGEEGPYTGNWDPNNEPNFDKGESFGKVDENAVKTIFLIFYDEDGKRVYTTQVRRENNATGTDGRNPSENSIYQGIVQVDVKHGSKKPTHVMCFINPITSQSFEMNPEFETMESLENTTRPQIIDDNGYFAMSKSVYFGIDRAKKDEQGNNVVQEDSPKNYEKIIATPIPDGSFFDTYNEAKEAIEAYDPQGEAVDPVLDIYVERYAAKVNLQFADGKKDGFIVKDMEGKDIVFGTNDQGDINLEFVPEYWAVNAYESETYVCKSFMNEAGTEDLTYTAMNTALGGSGYQTMPWFWNSPVHHRSYWAQTPGYYKKSYPRVGDDLLDHDAGHSIIDEENYALGYYSYTDLVNMSKESLNQPITRKVRDFSSNEKRTDGSTWPIYVRENTVSGQALQEAAKSDLMSAKAAIGSIILVGHYKYNGQDIDDTFWITGNATNGYTFFKNNEEVIDYLMNTSVRFAVQDGRNYKEVFKNALEDYGFTEDGKEVSKYFIMQHPTYDTRSQAGESGLVLDSRFETVQLDKEALLQDGAPVLYAQINNKWEAVTAENIDAINLQMLYQSGTAQGYQGGKAYFSIPVQHLGYYRKGNKNYENGLTANDKKFDWTQVRSGDFGLVRNHVYTVEIQDIVGLGNGIPNPDVPIVPPTDPEEYFIGARIIVLNWAIVPTQKVTL